MTMYVYQQQQQVQEPLEYIGQVLKGKTWVNICKPQKSFSLATGHLLKAQRKVRRSKGRVICTGVVSTQDYSRSKP